MAIIDRNQYGAIAVNSKVLSKILIDELLKHEGAVFPCNKKGKIIKNKPTPFIDPDLYDSVEILESRGIDKINIYIIIKFGLSISQTCNEIFDSIEKTYEMLRLNKPEEIRINVKGLMSKQIVRRDIVMYRNNNFDD